MKGAQGTADPLSEFQALVFVIDQDVEVDGYSLSPQLEVGVAIHSSNSDTPVQLLARATAVLSRVKTVDDPISASLVVGASLEDLVLE